MLTDVMNSMAQEETKGEEAMRKNFCTLLSLLLSVSLLAGCGASPEQRPNEEAAAEEAVPVSEETVYQAEYISLQRGFQTERR